MQSATYQAVEAIRELITSTIAAIDGIASAIAEAVEQQDAVARDMSAIRQTAGGVASIRDSSNLIAAATEAADAAARKVKEASRLPAA